jgi:hypothetical protein
MGDGTADRRDSAPHGPSCCVEGPPGLRPASRYDPGHRSYGCGHGAQPEADNPGEPVCDAPSEASDRSNRLAGGSSGAAASSGEQTTPRPAGRPNSTHDQNHSAARRANGGIEALYKPPENSSGGSKRPGQPLRQAPGSHQPPSDQRRHGPAEGPKRHRHRVRRRSHRHPNPAGQRHQRPPPGPQPGRGTLGQAPGSHQPPSDQRRHGPAEGPKRHRHRVRRRSHRDPNPAGQRHQRPPPGPNGARQESSRRPNAFGRRSRPRSSSRSTPAHTRSNLDHDPPKDM